MTQGAMTSKFQRIFVLRSRSSSAKHFRHWMVSVPSCDLKGQACWRGKVNQQTAKLPFLPAYLKLLLTCSPPPPVGLLQVLQFPPTLQKHAHWLETLNRSWVGVCARVYACDVIIKAEQRRSHNINNINTTSDWQLQLNPEDHKQMRL